MWSAPRKLIHVAGEFLQPAVGEERLEINFNYDLAGRMTSRQYYHAGGTLESTDTYTFNRDHRLLTAACGRSGVQTTYHYTWNLQPQFERTIYGGVTYPILTYYDLNGRVSSMTYPDSTFITHAYTPGGRLDKVWIANAQGQSPSQVIDLTYDLAGRETARLLGNGLTQTTSYNSGEHLVSNIAVSGRPELSFGYTFDANHNPTAETTGGVMANYSWSVPTGGFDAEDRLVNWSRANGNSQQWSLTHTGDWSSQTVNGMATSRTHSNVHEITAIGGTAVTHDFRGNLTQDQLARQFTWNYDNRLAFRVCCAASAQAMQKRCSVLARSIAGWLLDAAALC